MCHCYLVWVLDTVPIFGWNLPASSHIFFLQRTQCTLFTHLCTVFDVLFFNSCFLIPVYSCKFSSGLLNGPWVDENDWMDV